MRRVDCDFIGEWRATQFTFSGKRLDHEPGLSRLGNYRWLTRFSELQPTSHSGVFRQDRIQDRLVFEPTETSTPRLWKIHRLPGFDDANTIMILREVALASRNLPAFLSRVHAGQFPPIYDDLGYEKSG